MKTQNSLIASFVISALLAACSSAPKQQNSQSPEELMTLEEALTHRAIAESVSDGAVMIGRLVESATTTAAKKATLVLIETQLRAEGMILKKLTLANYKEVLAPLTEMQAAKVCYAISQSSAADAKALFTNAQAQAVRDEAANLIVGKTGYTSTSTGAATKKYSTTISGEKPLFNNEQRAAVNNLYTGFGGKSNPAQAKEFVKVAVNFEKNTGFKLWDQSTCTTVTTFKDPQAVAGLLDLGQANLKVSYSVAKEGYTGARATACGIKRAAAATLVNGYRNKHIDEQDLGPWVMSLAEPCNTINKQMVPAALELLAQGNISNLVPEEVPCN